MQLALTKKRGGELQFLGVHDIGAGLRLGSGFEAVELCLEILDENSNDYLKSFPLPPALHSPHHPTLKHP